MNEWKPITNAPLEKNIILFHKEHGTHIGYRRKGNLIDPYCEYQNSPNNRRYPTHWMPLPEPPKKEVDPTEDKVSEFTGPPPQKRIGIPQCGTCRWFVRNFSRESDHNKGICYCHPPTVVRFSGEDVYQKNPSVSLHHFCSHHKPAIYESIGTMNPPEMAKGDEQR